MISPAQQAMMAEGNARRTHHRTWRWRLWMWFIVALGLVLALYLWVVWPWSSRWGATREEVLQALPGDELIANPSLITTKAITIKAPPDKVWSWLVQLGVDRGGMYSYLWVENWLLRLNVENAIEINPEWQELHVGDFIRFTPQEYALNPGPGLYVMALEPNRALIGCFGMEGVAVDCNQSATWQFVLAPQADQSTRLILRCRTAGPPSPMAVFAGKLGSAFQFYMERKMLLTLKERAEMPNVAQLLPVAGLVQRD
jgi:hypothetical protein